MLNFEEKGRPICKISKGSKQKLLYLDENADLPPPISDEGVPCEYCGEIFARKDGKNRHIKTKACTRLLNPKKKGGVKPLLGKKNEIKNGIFTINDHSLLIPLPNAVRREIPYIAGPQGSGKSYYTADYLKEFKKIFPKKKIYLFSGIDEDINFKGIKGINKMDMEDQGLLDDPIDPKTELSNSLVIFDDIDRSADPQMSNYLHELRNDILKNGRDQSQKGKDIYCLSTNHQVTDSTKTRDLLNECTSITVFPSSGSRFGIERVLKHYMGFGKKEIDKIMDLGKKSRWVTIYKNYPQIIMHQKGCIMGSAL